MPRAEVSLPGAASSVPTARRFAESLLSSWGEPDAGWSAALCVSELAGNCALHARTDFTVGIALEGSIVRIEVRDGSPRVPTQRGYDAAATTGRGLRLVSEYSSSWGVEVSATGKTVWVLLDLRPAPSRHDDDVSDEPVVALLAGDEGDGAAGVRVRDAWPAAA